MKKLVSSMLMLLCTVAMMAQTDAASYFDNKPFGWGTCSSPEGQQFILNGGVGYGNPKTVTLTATGTDQDAINIQDAVKANDIIILDGSKGKFIIPQQISFKGMENKTIVGINNACLATKFYMTPEILKYLNDANLSGYSSTSQITGTLPNGQTVTVDERAFYTKKAMMEATGDMTMSFAKSGIFQFDFTDENIIIRNLTFEGPGSVDVDGVDLISQYGANYIWVDHCTFIDGQDGSLDSGKRPATQGPMYVSYTWNKFCYTSRSFSHPYSNGTGWMSGQNHQYITYAYCWWADGCGRRLPQADDVDIHVLNCYHSCSNNGAAIAINSRSNALVEGNYAEAYVNSPLSFADDGTTFYTTRNNRFTQATYYNTERNNGKVITVPYTYNMIACTEVPAVLKGTHGAGATLDNDMVLPVVEAKEKPEGPSTGEGVYATVKKWDFQKWSTASIANLAADTKTWTVESGNYTLQGTLKEAPLKANGVELAETQGLLFTQPSAGNLILYAKSSGGSIRINKSDRCVIVPDCKAGDKILVTFRSANSTDERGMSSSQTEPSVILKTAQITGEYTVKADGNVTFNPTGGLYLVAIELQRLDTDGIKDVTIGAENAKNEYRYNLQGQRVGANQKGLVIVGGRKVIIK